MSPDAGETLARAIRAGLAGFAGALDLERSSRRWASITFSGERHRLCLHLGGAGAAAAADAFLEGLSEREFDLRGHILADIALVGDDRDGGGVRLVLEALTVEAD